LSTRFKWLATASRNDGSGPASGISVSPAASPAHPLKPTHNARHAGKSKAAAARRNAPEPRWGCFAINACNSCSRLDFRLAGVLVGKPASIFPGHAQKQPRLVLAMLNRDRGNRQVS
jgi:hypothetical protein